MKRVFKLSKGQRMHRDKLKVAFLEKAQQIYRKSDSMQSKYYNNRTYKKLLTLLAQLVERLTLNQNVKGSSPL